MDFSDLADRFLDPFRGPTHLTLADQIAIARAPKRAAPAPAQASAAPGPMGGGPMPDGTLGAGVAPASLSRDYGKGARTLYHGFLPGVSAEDAIRPAQADAARINAARHPYLGVTSNSNSVIGDFTARQYGHRVGQGMDRFHQGWTPGFDYDLPQTPPTDPIPPGDYRPTTPIW